jgi:hypothetical protein
MPISIPIVHARDAARCRQPASSPSLSKGSINESGCAVPAFTGQSLTRLRRLSELQYEADELRRKLRTSESSSCLASPIAVLTAAVDMGGTPESLAASMSPRRPPGYLNPVPVTPANIHPTPVLPQEGSVMRTGGRTLARTLNGVLVEAEEIDDIFQLFVP